MTAFDVIVRNGSMVDGTGAPAVFADVGITGDRISAIGDLQGERAIEEIDAEGHVVTPGFVDIHTHLGAQLAWDPIKESLVLARRDDRRDGELRVAIAPCRPDDRVPRGDDGVGRGHTGDRDPQRASVGLANLRYLASVDRMPKA